LFSPRHPFAWWASSRRNARGAFLGAVTLVLALTGTSVVVWTTPSISPATTATRVVKSITEAEQLRSERDRLAARVAQLTAQLNNRSASLGYTRAQLDASSQSVASLKAQLSQLQGAQSSKSAKSSGLGKPTAVGAPVTAPSKSQLLSPASPYFGMYTEQAPFNFASFDATATEVGARPSMVGYFAGWDQSFRADAVTSAWKRNMLPMMTWESRPINDANGVVNAPTYSLPNIIAGNFDAYLHQYAKDIVTTGLPMAIRLDHEMNSTWYPWVEDDGHGNSINGNGAGDYVKMWQHVHDIFQAEGANQYVIWVWAPNRVDNLTTTHRALSYLQSLYPGDDDVDWVGMSGYLRPPFAADQQYTFDETFGATLGQLRAIAKKPIILAEVGATETDGHKPTWIANFFTGLNADENRDIIGFSWFDLAISTYVQGSLATNDWRIDSRPESLAAFTAGLLGSGSRFHLDTVK
jgi:mannan endo-1,4-beta-mannosidase